MVDENEYHPETGDYLTRALIKDVTDYVTEAVETLGGQFHPGSPFRRPNLKAKVVYLPKKRKVAPQN